MLKVSRSQVNRLSTNRHSWEIQFFLGLMTNFIFPIFPPAHKRKTFLFVNFKCFLSVSGTSRHAKGVSGRRRQIIKKSITARLYWQRTRDGIYSLFMKMNSGEMMMKIRGNNWHNFHVHFTIAEKASSLPRVALRGFEGGAYGAINVPLSLRLSFSSEET